MLAVIAIGALYIWREYNRTVHSLYDVKPDYLVNATALINEFVTDETTANEKYQNKILSVKGTVKKVDSAGAADIVVLGDTADMSSVRCLLDSNTTFAGASLQRGDVVTIKGAIIGFNKDETGLLGSDVQLNRCVFAD